MLTKKIILLFLTMLLISSCKAQNLEQYLDEVYKNGKINGNVLVTKNDQVLLEKSFGLADPSKKTPLNKDFRFNIGSIYKEFPAVVIMQLHEDNKLDLADKVSKYLPYLPAWSKDVSLKNLLQYSSGLPQINWSQYFEENITITDEHIDEELQNIEKLEFTPGADYLYSNLNPILLIKIIEQISNISFEDYLRTRIFEPSGMESTVIKEQYPYLDRKLMAIPFNENYEEDEYKLSISNLLFCSTTKDMLTWFQKLEEFEIIEKESLLKLSEVAIEGDNIQSPLGFTVWENGDIIEHTHHGSTANYEVIVRSFKEDNISIVILTNQNNHNVYEISEEIYQIIKSGN